MSQGELAAGLCSAATISRWESGQIQPDPAVVPLLAQRLGLKEEELLGRTKKERLSFSPQSLPTLLAMLADPRGTAEYPYEQHEPVMQWVILLRSALASADPWKLPSAAGVLDAQALLAHPLSAMNPETLEAAQLLQPMVALAEGFSVPRLKAFAQTFVDSQQVPRLMMARALECLAFLTYSHEPADTVVSLLKREANLPWTPATAALGLKLGVEGKYRVLPWLMRDHLFMGWMQGAPADALMRTAMHTDYFAADYLPIIGEVSEELVQEYRLLRPELAAPWPLK